MPGLVPGISMKRARAQGIGIAGTRPVMTIAMVDGVSPLRLSEDCNVTA